MLVVDQLGFGFGATPTLEGVAFEAPATGVTVILGPGGVGKSTLLRTLARRAELLPSFWWTGRVTLDGRDVLREHTPDEARRRIALLAQKARLYTASVLDNALAAFDDEQRTTGEKRELAREVLERGGVLAELGDHLATPVVSLPLGLQRRLSLARIATREPAVILADEPTRDITAGEQAAIERQLVAEARRRAVLLITHDLGLARRVASRVVLLVARHQIYGGPAGPFFARPPDEISRRFLAHGNAWPDEELAVAPPPVKPRRDPSSFRWVLPGLLGGMARPGLLNPERDDLEALAALGVHTLVTLEEDAFSPRRLAEHGLAGAHLPIPDMGAPSVDAAAAVIDATEARLRRGEPTVYHCKGGLGRTGTLLAAHLVHRGMTPLRALEELRTIHPLYVQSDTQELFLEVFAADRARALRPGPAAHA